MAERKEGNAMMTAFPSAAAAPQLDMRNCLYEIAFVAVRALVLVRPLRRKADYRVKKRKNSAAC